MKKFAIAFVCVGFLFVAWTTTLGGNDLPGDPIMQGNRLYHFYRHFGSEGGEIFDRPKDAYICEGAIGTLRDRSGRTWMFDLENEPVFGNLEKRPMYFALLRADDHDGCGHGLKAFSPAPDRCVTTERVLTWPEAKKFIRDNTSEPYADQKIASLESDLRSRVGMRDSWNAAAARANMTTLRKTYDSPTETDYRIGFGPCMVE